MAMYDILSGFHKSVIDAFGLREPDTTFLPYWGATKLAEELPAGVKVVAWRRPGRCLVMMVNTGDERIDVSLRLNAEAMEFAESAIGALRIQQLDPELPTYFDFDVTNVKQAVLGEEEEDEFGLEERDEDVPIEERRAKNPDGKVAWQNARLQCPVRRHDYRLFMFFRADTAEDGK